mmetsp:Transcript_5702/g.25353  ORF Transcript_5702/g.25353 Transcript_5702/m.25353 type:complete len:210 (+) Transcript_5702:793-1422(+)
MASPHRRRRDAGQDRILDGPHARLALQIPRLVVFLDGVLVPQTLQRRLDVHLDTLDQGPGRRDVFVSRVEATHEHLARIFRHAEPLEPLGDVLQPGEVEHDLRVEGVRGECLPLVRRDRLVRREVEGEDALNLAGVDQRELGLERSVQQLGVDLARVRHILEQNHGQVTLRESLELENQRRDGTHPLFTRKKQGLLFPRCRRRFGGSQG